MEHQKLTFSSTKNKTSMIYESLTLELFILVLALYSYCGDKSKIQTSFKSLASKSGRTWQLKKPRSIDRLSWKTEAAVWRFSEEIRSSRLGVFCRKGVLRNFTQFTVKHLCRSLLFDKVAGLSPDSSLDFQRR